MSFKLGLVGLCTSHPESWVPIIRKMTKAGTVDVEIVCAWDSGETRPEGFAEDFCKEHNIPNAIENLEDMIDMVDGVIVHTTNWDKHIEQAKPFIDADKAVLLDKPIAGNLKEINIILDWMKQGKRITGGSSLRFSKEPAELLAKPEEERGVVHTAYAAIGVDDYNYGIHGYAALCGLMGGDILSVKFLSANQQKNIQIKWTSGNIALMTFGKSKWLPFNLTAVTTENVFQMELTMFYELFLENVLPYITGKTDETPLSIEEIAAPELAALAARQSWLNNGQEVFITDLREDDPGYDGTQFALEYRRARIG
jgi:hypothetical protein